MKSENTISEMPQLVKNKSEVEQEKAIVTSELEGIAKVRLEVIQSLIEPCDRATYGDRLRAGAKKLDISVARLRERTNRLAINVGKQD